jgi:hypothetical protein
MTDNQAYRLSRIHAEGWKAARALSASELADLKPTEIDARNPHPADPERARWRAGFTYAR